MCVHSRLWACMDPEWIYSRGGELRSEGDSLRANRLHSLQLNNVVSMEAGGRAIKRYHKQERYYKQDRCHK